MERKIGEVFKFGGEWYQCVVAIDGCRECSFRAQGYCTRLSECFSDVRRDGISVIFKKLEKVGEPFFNEHFGLVQKYELKMYGYSTKDKRVCFADGYDVFIKPKQTKEDMEDLDKIKVRDSTKVEELNVMEENKLNLKPFDIQKAREGKPVYTRDGRKARIICFDYNGETGDYPIVALVHYNKGNKYYERVLKYTSDGIFNIYGDCQHDDDLMMLPEKRSGWININKDAGLFKSKEEAERDCTKDYATVRVEFEI